MSRTLKDEEHLGGSGSTRYWSNSNPEGLFKAALVRPFNDLIHSLMLNLSWFQRLKHQDLLAAV